MEIVHLPTQFAFQIEEQTPVKSPKLRIFDLLEKSGSADQFFPATEFYNEEWLLRIVLDWFATRGIVSHPLTFSPGCRWFSEGLIPSQFIARFRGDPLAENWTHADGIIGHFEVGRSGRADISLIPSVRHLVIVEAKLFSRLSSGVTNARYFNQAARYVASMAEMLARANWKPYKVSRLGFYVIAPQSKIAARNFWRLTDPQHIRKIVERRVAEYRGEKDRWFKDWFLPCLDRLKIKCLSWESIIKKIDVKDPLYGKELKAIYDECLYWAQPELNDSRCA